MSMYRCVLEAQCSSYHECMKEHRCIQAGATKLEEDKKPPSSPYYPLFEHMDKEHGLVLVDSELEEIVRISKGISEEVS